MGLKLAVRHRLSQQTKIGYLHGYERFRQRHGSFKQVDGWQVDLLLSRCLFHAATDPCHAARSTHPVPNTALASDTSDGTSTVLIGRREVMLKNKSNFKQSTGDEAGCAPKKNVVTSKIKGKAYFVAWSMNVKVEGENVVRHLDLTTHNHGSMPAGAPPQLHAALQAMPQTSDCDGNRTQVEKKCSPWKKKAKCPDDTEKKIVAAEAARQAAKEAGDVQTYAAENAKVRLLYKQYAYEMEGVPCRRALRCVMVPYSEIDRVGCPKQTGDHLIEQATVNHLGKYDINAAPTATVEGPSYHIGTHGIGHRRRTVAARSSTGVFDLEQSAKIAAKEHCKTHSKSNCSESCIAQQLIEQHKSMGINKSDPVKKPRLDSHHNETFEQEWLTRT